jgi:hypothetical protein
MVFIAAEFDDGVKLDYLRGKKIWQQCQIGQSLCQLIWQICPIANWVWELIVDEIFLFIDK